MRRSWWSSAASAFLLSNSAILVTAELCRYFAEQITKRGLVGLLLAQSPEYVAPHGATEAIFGTNPIAVGIPTGKGSDPVIFDMATAAIAW